MPEPLFSVIIPSFESVAKLPDTINSLLSQGYKGFEVIIADGGSCDGSVDLLESYGDKLRYFSAPDCGIYDAMNKAIAISTGQYLYFLGAGDKLCPGILETIARSIPTNTTAFIYGDIVNSQNGARVGGKFTRLDFTRHRNISHQAIFYDRRIFDMVGIYDMRYKIRADNVLNMRAFADPSIQKIYIDQVIADFEGGGISDSQTDQEFEADFVRLIRKNFGIGYGILAQGLGMKNAGKRVSL